MPEKLFGGRLTSRDRVEKCAEALSHGSLIAFPTETVYGLGADADNEVAVKRIYAVKNRPKDHPLIVHIGELDKVDLWTNKVPTYAKSLMRDYWPGPLTLIFKSVSAKAFITGDQDSVGIRMPANDIAMELLHHFHFLGGRGIAAPSANRFGAVSPTSAHAVEEEIGSRLEVGDYIIDGGQCEIGIESTIVDCTADLPRILRPGAISALMINKSTKMQLEQRNEIIRVPGLLEKHYSPKAVVFTEGQIKEGDGFLALSDIATPRGAIRIASPKSVEEFARVLYSSLRRADSKGLERVQIICPTGPGIALAIRDRVQKASVLSQD